MPIRDSLYSFRFSENLRKERELELRYLILKEGLQTADELAIADFQTVCETIAKNYVFLFDKFHVYDKEQGEICNEHLVLVRRESLKEVKGMLTVIKKGE